MSVAHVADSAVAAARSSQLLGYASYDAVDLIERASRVMSQSLAESLRQARSICSQDRFAWQQRVGDIKLICQECDLPVNALIVKF